MKRRRSIRNPVAKHATRVNRADVHRDRTKYRRKPKHKGRDPFAEPAAAAVWAKGAAA